MTPRRSCGSGRKPAYIKTEGTPLMEMPRTVHARGRFVTQAFGNPPWRPSPTKAGEDMDKDILERAQDYLGGIKDDPELIIEKLILEVIDLRKKPSPTNICADDHQ